MEEIFTWCQKELLEILPENLVYAQVGVLIMHILTKVYTGQHNDNQISPFGFGQ